VGQGPHLAPKIGKAKILPHLKIKAKIKAIGLYLKLLSF
jgi:hypothetical protein